MLPGPQWTQRAHILVENPFSIPITDKFSFDPNSDLLAGQRPALAVLRTFLSSQSLTSRLLVVYIVYIIQYIKSIVVQRIVTGS